MSATVAIPRHPADVTSEWLSTVLSRREGAVEVTDVVVSAVGTGQTGASYRVTATYANRPAGIPDSFVIKLPAQDDEVRGRVTLGYRSECAFYSSVASRVHVPVPAVFHCEITDDANDYALLLEDQAPAVQGDQIAGCGPQEAELAARAIAGLHAPTWNDPYWLTFSGLAMTLQGDDAIKGLGDIAKMSADITVEKLGPKLSRPDAEMLTVALGSVTPWLLHAPDRYALMHGDYRLDNLLFTPDRSRVSVVDWQTLGVGLPARDLAYFTGTSLEPDVRAAIEDQLVNHYHDALVQYGVVGYDRESCWYDYRYGMLQSLLIIALGCAFANATERGEDMFAVMLRRGCRALTELGTLSLIDEASTSGSDA